MYSAAAGHTDAHFHCCDSCLRLELVQKPVYPNRLEIHPEMRGGDGESRVKGDKGKPRINMNSWGGEEDRDIEA